MTCDTNIFRLECITTSTLNGGKKKGLFINQIIWENYDDMIIVRFLVTLIKQLNTKAAIYFCLFYCCCMKIYLIWLNPIAHCLNAG